MHLLNEPSPGNRGAMGNFLKKAATGTILWAFLVILFYFVPPFYTALTMLLILIFILLFEWPKFFSFKTIKFWLITPFYPILPFSLIIYMSSIEQYRSLLFYMLILVSCHDMGGYAIGSTLGKHKLAERISPNKTWEGFWGGYILTLAAMTIFAYAKNMNTPYLWIIMFTLLICTLATIGDLAESSLKRRVGLKDSSYILPGHGGFLDRFDSISTTILFLFLFKDHLVTVFKI